MQPKDTNSPYCECDSTLTESFNAHFPIRMVHSKNRIAHKPLFIKWLVNGTSLMSSFMTNVGVKLWNRSPEDLLICQHICVLDKTHKSSVKDIDI